MTIREITNYALDRHKDIEIRRDNWPENETIYVPGDGDREKNLRDLYTTGKKLWAPTAEDLVAEDWKTVWE